MCDYAGNNKKTIATSGGIEAVARAMTVHAFNNGVQGQAVWAIENVLWNSTPAHIATAKAAGLVTLLQRAVAMGVRKGEQYGDPANQLNKMGVDEEKSEGKQREEAVVVVRRSVCPGYKKMGMFKFSAKCKTCGKAKDAH